MARHSKRKQLCTTASKAASEARWETGREVAAESDTAAAMAAQEVDSHALACASRCYSTRLAVPAQGGPPLLLNALLDAAAHAAAPAAAGPSAPFERLLNTCFVVACVTLLASLVGFATALCVDESGGCCPVMQELSRALRDAVPALGGGATSGGATSSVSLRGFLNAMFSSECAGGPLPRSAPVVRLRTRRSRRSGSQRRRSS